MVKNPPANAGGNGRCGFHPRVGKIPWPTPVFFVWEIPWTEELVGYRPWDPRVRQD